MQFKLESVEKQNRVASFITKEQSLSTDNYTNFRNLNLGRYSELIFFSKIKMEVHKISLTVGDSIIVLSEIREMIFRHLEAETRLETALVCPTFYGSICSIERNKTVVLSGEVTE